MEVKTEESRVSGEKLVLYRYKGMLLKCREIESNISKSENKKNVEKRKIIEINFLY